MGGLVSYFYGSTESNISKDERVELELKIARDRVNRFVQRLKQQMGKNRELAKEHLAKNNRMKAKIALAQSKTAETHIAAAEGQLTMLYDQIQLLKDQQNRKAVINVLKEGNEVIKRMQQECNLERMVEITDELEDIKEDNEEISEWLRSKGLEIDVDLEAEVENEMKNLAKEEKEWEFVANEKEEKKEIKKVKKQLVPV